MPAPYVRPTEVDEVLKVPYRGPIIVDYEYSDFHVDLEHQGRIYVWHTDEPEMVHLPDCWVIG